MNNPLNKLLDFFTTVMALVLTFLAAPKTYHLSEPWMLQYIAENLGNGLVEIGMIGWRLAVGAMVFGTLKLILYITTAGFIARN